MSLPDVKAIVDIICYFTSTYVLDGNKSTESYMHADIRPGHLILNPNTGIVGLIAQ